ncbi:unnamed protein product [Didymodactylos carnosus]|uniref:Uncharacterized protein n=1 Tax=Didymodactylos carnosus TaxID=1234261 RepID=A0A8S2KN24_9BILA|nr:unnamed protein product [Didymodactylos carnosus]CAF3860947.1 unnamed protein product [Didymodactylos carnosus]
MLALFSVEILGEEHHNAGEEVAGQQLTGDVGLEMAKHAAEIGPLNVFESNVRKADNVLLSAGNFTYVPTIGVPTIGVIKSAAQEYRRKFRYDKDIFKEVRILREALLASDSSSKHVTGNLSKTEIKKEHRHVTIKLFAISLNCNIIFDALRLFETISLIYGDPSQTNVDKAVEPLLPVTDVLDFDLKEFLKDDTDDDLDELSPVDDLLESSDPIIHQSPFSIIAREQIPFLQKALSERSKPLIPPTNPYYTKKVIDLFYRWWAYLPMWTCILVDYKERYASDKPVSADTSVLGRGRLSNAIAESSTSASGVSPLRATSTDSQSVDSLDISYDAESVINAKTKRSSTSIDDIQPQSTTPSNPHEDLADDLQLVD